MKSFSALTSLRGTERRGNPNASVQPVVFNLSIIRDAHSVEKLLRKKQVQHISDDYEEQERELFAIRNPALVFSKDFESSFQKQKRLLDAQGPSYKQGRWVWYPWRGSLAHILEDAAFQLVRTARNRHLITEEEQKKFYDAVVGIAGLSVGNSVALAIVLQGGARRIRLADFDNVALSNLNRIRASVAELGTNKTVMTTRQIYEINPYAKVDIFSEGLTPKNIERFFTASPKLDVIVDEMDNLAMKFLIRKNARLHRIPVVMAADNGDNGVVDIERYDLNPKTKFFHGRLGNVSYEKLSRLNKMDIGRLITKHVGPENVTERMQKSLTDIGRGIVSWPQLGGAALLNGSAIAYCVRRIVNGQSLAKNRVIVSLDNLFVPDHHSKIAQKRRAHAATAFRKMFDL